MRRPLIRLVLVVLTLTPWALAAQRPAQACDQLAAAVRSSPDDLDASIRFGQCSIRDFELADSTSDRLAFRSEWTPALRALRHVVELDPDNGRAYRSLFRILLSEIRDSCDPVTGLCAYHAAVIRDGDSILTIPRRFRRDIEFFDTLIVESRAARRPSMEEARVLATRWSEAAPKAWQPHHYLGRALLGLAEWDRAATEMETATRLGGPDARREVFEDYLETLLRGLRGREAVALLDQIIADPGHDTTQAFARHVSEAYMFLGRNRPPPLDSSRRMVELRARGIARRDSILGTAPTRPRSPGFTELLAQGDTAGARRQLAKQESMMLPPDGALRRFPLVGEWIIGLARNHLALGDSLAAEQQLRRVDVGLETPQFPRWLGLVFELGRPWLGRAWLLSGTLAEARGRPADARSNYERLIGLWEAADPEFSVLVEEARTRVARLPPQR